MLDKPILKDYLPMMLETIADIAIKMNEIGYTNSRSGTYLRLLTHKFWNY